MSDFSVDEEKHTTVLDKEASDKAASELLNIPLELLAQAGQEPTEPPAE